MPLNHSAEFWTSARGAALLQQAGQILEHYKDDPAAAAINLRRTAGNSETPATLSEALEISYARIKAKHLGLATDGWLLSKQSLEQSTHPAIAAAHAARFTGCRRVLEICCGAGFDTAALVKRVGNVVGIEADAKLASFARHNLKKAGAGNATIEAGRAEDFVPGLDTSQFDGLWADPSRRDTHGRRIMNPTHYKPSLQFLMNLAVRGVRGIKVSPALGLASLPSGWSREWIGFGRECREQVLWHGTDMKSHCVNLIDCGASWSTEAATTLKVSPEIITPAEAIYLIEPHAALIASGMVHEFFRKAGIALLDPDLLVGAVANRPPRSAFYSVFRQVSHFPYSFRQLRMELGKLTWGKRTEIKKRLVDDDPDLVRIKLKLPDSDTFGVVYLVSVYRKKIAFLAQRET